MERKFHLNEYQLSKLQRNSKAPLNSRKAMELCRYNRIKSYAIFLIKYDCVHLHILEQCNLLKVKQRRNEASKIPIHPISRNHVEKFQLL